jgi:hypothetical protein
LGSLQAWVDVFDAALLLETGDGRRARIDLAEPRTVARVFAELQAALKTLGVEANISPLPQEVPDLTPFDADERPAAFVVADARRWLAVMTATNAVFDRWRAHFFGRTGIQLWWGALDFALLLFNGKHVEPPKDRGYLFKYDLDAEMFNAGFYPGDDANPAIFYAYIYPQPPACETIRIAPEGASWSTALGEWILPYETVRAASDPERALVAFLDSVYDACATAAGWDRKALAYTPPPLRSANSAGRSSAS